MGRKPDDYRQQHKKNVRSTSYCRAFQNQAGPPYRKRGKAAALQAAKALRQEKSGVQ